MPASSIVRTPGPLQAIVLLLQCTLAVMGTVILAPVIPMIIAHFSGVPNVAFWGPLVVTVTSFGAIFGSPVAGYLADRLGRRRLLLAALLLYAAFGILPMFLDTIAQLLLVRLLLGLVEAVIMTTSTTMIGDYFSGPQRDRWLGYQTAIASISAVVLLALGGIAGQGGWRAPFLLYLFSLPLFALVMRYTWETGPDAHQSVAAIRWAEFPWRKMAAVYLLTLPAGMMFYIVQIDMGIALGEVGVQGSSRIGFITALVSIGIPVGTLIFQRLSTLMLPGLLMLDFLCVATGFLGMSRATSLGMLCLFAVINQIGCGLLLPTLVTWAMRRLDFSMRGRGTGIWQAILSLGPPLGPAVVAFLALYHGGHVLPAFAPVGFVAATLAAGAMLVALRAVRTKPAETGT